MKSLVSIMAAVLKFLDLFLISLHCKAKIGEGTRKLMICDRVRHGVNELWHIAYFHFF